MQEGRFRFDHAVDLAHVGTRYERINAMQSRIDGLDEWISISSATAGMIRLADAYNTVKHPNRTSEWSTLDLSNVPRESRLLFRAWVARRLGVKAAVLERRRGLLPMNRAPEPW